MCIRDSARINCNAQGGISLINGAGYFDNYIGMETVYKQMGYEDVYKRQKPCLYLV